VNVRKMLLTHGCTVLSTFLLFSVHSAELKEIGCKTTTISSMHGNIVVSCSPDHLCPCFIPANFSQYFPARFNVILRKLANPRRSILKTIQRLLRLGHRDTMSYQDVIDLLEESYETFLDQCAEESTRQRFGPGPTEYRVVDYLDRYLFDFEDRSNLLNLDANHVLNGMREERVRPNYYLLKIESVLDYYVMKEFAELFKAAQENGVPSLFDLIRDSILCGFRVDIAVNHSYSFMKKLMNMVNEFLQKVELTKNREAYLQMLNKTQLVSLNDFFLSDETMSYFKSRIQTSLGPWLIENRQQIEEEALNLYRSFVMAYQGMENTDPGLHLFMNIKMKQLIEWLRKDRFIEDVFRHWLMYLPPVSDSFIDNLEQFASDPNIEALDTLSDYIVNTLTPGRVKWELKNFVMRMRALVGQPPACVTNIQRQTSPKEIYLFGMKMEYEDYFVLLCTYYSANFL